MTGYASSILDIVLIFPGERSDTFMPFRRAMPKKRSARYSMALEHADFATLTTFSEPDTLHIPATRRVVSCNITTKMSTLLSNLQKE